jgi:hypothetical protein
MKGTNLGEFEEMMLLTIAASRIPSLVWKKA